MDDSCGQNLHIIGHSNLAFFPISCTLKTINNQERYLNSPNIIGHKYHKIIKLFLKYLKLFFQTNFSRIIKFLNTTRNTIGRPSMIRRRGMPCCFTSRLTSSSIRSAAPSILGSSGAYGLICFRSNQTVLTCPIIGVYGLHR